MGTADEVFEEKVGEGGTAVRGRDGGERLDFERRRLEVRDEEAAVESALEGN